MAVSDYKELRNMLRTNARDMFSVQWSDAALDTIINDAQREYSFYAQNLVGEFEIKSSASGVVRLPEDFISPIKAIDNEGREIPVVSWRKLVEQYDDFRKVKGEKVNCFCFDIDGYRYMRLFPAIDAGVNVGKLIYTRFSADNKWETDNKAAIKEHCLFQMSFVSGNGKYNLHYGNFIRLINEETRSNHTLNVRKNIRNTMWY